MAALRRLQLEQLVQSGFDAAEAAAVAALIGQSLAQVTSSGGSGADETREVRGRCILVCIIQTGSSFTPMVVNPIFHARCGAGCPRRCCDPTTRLRCTSCCLPRRMTAGTQVGIKGFRSCSISDRY